MYEPPYRVKNMMPGMIMLWYGSVASIPSGWHHCDGTMGTPDLRANLVLAVDADDGSYPPGASGGAYFHKHNFTGDGHSHTIPEGTGLAAGDDYALETESDPAVGLTDNWSGFPPYTTLCYIMKL